MLHFITDYKNFLFLLADVYVLSNPVEKEVEFTFHCCWIFLYPYIFPEVFLVYENVFFKIPTSKCIVDHFDFSNG